MKPTTTLPERHAPVCGAHPPSLCFSNPSAYRRRHNVTRLTPSSLAALLFVAPCLLEDSEQAPRFG